MRVLITGASGFIGRNLLTALEHEIHGLTQDLAVPLNLTALPREIDAVIHLAQSRHYREFPDRALDMFNVNVAATLQLLEYARSAGAKRFILASSGSVYGAGPRPFTEDDEPKPPDFYAVTKWTAEQIAAQYRKYFDVIVLRPFFVYGHGQTGRLIPGLVDRIANDQPITVDGAEGIRINPVHVSDCVRAIAAALDHDGQLTVNIAGEETVSMLDLAMRIAALMGRAPHISHTDMQREDILGDITRMRQTLGAPTVRLADGLADVVR